MQEIKLLKWNISLLQEITFLLIAKFKGPSKLSSFWEQVVTLSHCWKTNINAHIRYATRSCYWSITPVGVPEENPQVGKPLVTSAFQRILSNEPWLTAIRDVSLTSLEKLHYLVFQSEHLKFHYPAHLTREMTKTGTAIKKWDDLPPAPTTWKPHQ